MSTERKRIIIKAFDHVVYLLILYVIQTMILSRIAVWGVKPLIFPIAVVGVGLFEDQIWGGWFGAAAGMLCDSAFINNTALFTIIFMLTGSFIGFASNTFLVRGFPSFVVCSAAALLITAFSQMFGLLVFGGLPFSLLGRTAWLQTAYSMLFILPLYYPSRRIGRKKVRLQPDR